MAALWLTSEKIAWHQLAALRPEVMLACVLLSAMIVLLLAWRWRFVVSSFETERDRLPAVSTFVSLTWVGLAVNQFVPSVVGGDALRASLLVNRGISAAASAGSVLADRAYGLAGLAVLCILGAPVLDRGLVGSAMLAIAIVAAVLAGIGLFTLAAGRRFAPLARFAGALRETVSPRLIVALVPASVLSHLASIAIFLLIAHGLGAELPVLPTIAVLSSVFLISVLPFSIAGWGLREFTLVQAFGSAGIDADKIVLSSIAYGLILLVTQGCGFLLILMRSRP